MLRRLARATAPFTQRWKGKPPSWPRDQENIAPGGEFELSTKGRSRGLDFGLSTDDSNDSTEEDDNSPVAPTSTAQLDDSSDPREPIKSPRNTEVNKLPKSPDQSTKRAERNTSEAQEVDESETTYMSEQGRKATSVEPAVLSRYSFGSIHMDGFGPELGVRRGSDEQKEPAEVLDADRHVHGARIAIDPPYDIEFVDDTEIVSDHEAFSPSPVEQTTKRPPMVVLDDTNDFQFEFVDKTALARRRVQSRQDSVLQPRSRIENNHASEPVSAPSRARARPQKRLKLTQTGNVIPSLPSSLIRRVVHQSYALQGKKRPILGREHMTALEQATEWFFEQASKDVSAFSQHGGRKKRIIADDVLLLMRRQRVLAQPGELMQFAKEWLPQDVFKQVDLPG